MYKTNLPIPLFIVSRFMSGQGKAIKSKERSWSDVCNS